jgi:MFS family permease
MTSPADTPTPDAPRRAGLLVRARGELRVFPRQFWLLALGFFVLLCGIDMCFPFETTYLHDRLGYSMTTIGLLLGVPLLAALPFYIIDGAITDRYGRKPAMIAGICAVITLYLTLAFAGALWQIAVAVSVEAAFGWALFLTGSNAMVADLVPFERRAEAYSITRVALHVGMVVGPLLASVVLAADPTYRWLFLSGAAICAAFVVIVLTLFRETLPKEARTGEPLHVTVRGYGIVLRDRRFLAFCAVALLPLYAFGQIWSIFPVMLRNAHGVSPGTWGLVIAFYALSVAVFQYPVIRWLRRRDHIKLMAAASAFIGLGLGGAVLVPWGVATFACVFLLGQGVLLLIPISSTVSAELAPIALRGRYMGTWTLVQMAGYALGPTFGGLAMDRLGERGAALVIVACGLTGAALYWALARLLLARDAAAGTPATAEPMAGDTPPSGPPVA